MSEKQHKVTYMFLGGLPNIGSNTTYKTWVEYFKGDVADKNQIIYHPMKMFDKTDEFPFMDKYVKSFKKVGDLQRKFREETKNNNVHCVPFDRWVNTKWGHFSLVQATLSMLFHALFMDEKTKRPSSKFILVDHRSIPLYTAKKTRQDLGALKGCLIRRGSQWMTFDQVFMQRMRLVLRPTFMRVDYNGVNMHVSKPFDNVNDYKVTCNSIDNKVIDNTYGYVYEINGSQVQSDKPIHEFLSRTLIRFDYSNKNSVPDEYYFQELAGHLNVDKVALNSIKLDKKALGPRVHIHREYIDSGSFPVLYKNSENPITTMRNNYQDDSFEKLYKRLKLNEVRGWSDYIDGATSRYDEESAKKGLSTTFTDWNHFQLNYNNLFRFSPSRNDNDQKEINMMKNLTDEIIHAVKSNQAVSRSWVRDKVVKSWLMKLPTFMMSPYHHPLEYIDNSAASGCKNRLNEEGYTEKECSETICKIVKMLKDNNIQIPALYERMVEVARSEADQWFQQNQALMMTQVSAEEYDELITRKAGHQLAKIATICSILYNCQENIPFKAFDLNPISMNIAKECKTFFIRKVDSDSDKILELWKLSSGHDLRYVKESILKIKAKAKANMESIALYGRSNPSFITWFRALNL